MQHRRGWTNTAAGLRSATQLLQQVSCRTHAHHSRTRTAHRSPPPARTHAHLTQTWARTLHTRQQFRSEPPGGATLFPLIHSSPSLSAPQGRANAQKRALLITDGPSNFNSFMTPTSAHALRSLPAKVAAVGIGRAIVLSELQVRHNGALLRQHLVSGRPTCFVIWYG